MGSTSMTDGTPKSPESSSFVLTAHDREVIRLALKATCASVLGVPYKFGAKWTDLSKIPEALDCSGLVCGAFHKNGLKMPDGSQAQFDFTLAVMTPQPGDLAFFGEDRSMNKICHVGVVYDEAGIIEARGLQPESSFPTGKVIIRPRANWETYAKFVGYRAHPKLI